MVAEKNNADSSGITPGDYESLIKISPKNILIIFLLIFLIIGSLLYGFNYIQRRNSNIKVEEARVLIDRGDTAPEEPGPETLELEEMVAETEEEVNWLVEQLVADRFADEFGNELEDRYRREMYYSARQDLPSGWKDDLPTNLEQWRQQRIAHRQEEVEQFLAELEGFISTQKERLNRGEEIRSNLAEQGEMPPVQHRYEEARRELSQLLEEIEMELEGAVVGGPQIPAGLYDLLAELVDRLSKFTLQYRRINALTTAPSAYLYAEQYLQDALRIDPRNPEAFYQLGRVYERLEQDVIASEYYLRMIKEAPSYRRVSEMVTQFEKTVEENPESARAHYDLGFAYYEVDRHKEALASLLNVLEVECDIEGNLDFIVEAYDAGDYAEAGELVTETITRTGCESESMTQVLAEIRIGYILEGEPPYHKMAYH